MPKTNFFWNFQELPLQPAYSVSDVSHQVFDQVIVIRSFYWDVLCLWMWSRNLTLFPLLFVYSTPRSSPSSCSTSSTKNVRGSGPVRYNLKFVNKIRYLKTFKTCKLWTPKIEPKSLPQINTLLEPLILTPINYPWLTDLSRASVRIVDPFRNLPDQQDAKIGGKSWILGQSRRRRRLRGSQRVCQWYEKTWSAFGTCAAGKQQITGILHSYSTWKKSKSPKRKFDHMRLET